MTINELKIPYLISRRRKSVRVELEQAVFGQQGEYPNGSGRSAAAEDALNATLKIN